MRVALAEYESALRSGAARLHADDGGADDWPVLGWSAAATDADQAMLDRCTGPTLDVGCGPGRLVGALTQRGVPALGIDISTLAVDLTTARGAAALRRDVFRPLPGAGRWSFILLADGNIGIGGDPVALLERCRELLAPGGAVLLDVEPPGRGLTVQDVRLESAGVMSPPFRWGRVGADALDDVVRAARGRVRERWLCGPRWQAALDFPRSDDRGGAS